MCDWNCSSGVHLSIGSRLAFNASRSFFLSVSVIFSCIYVLLPLILQLNSTMSDSIRFCKLFIGHYEQYWSLLAAIIPVRLHGMRFRPVLNIDGGIRKDIFPFWVSRMQVCEKSPHQRSLHPIYHFSRLSKLYHRPQRLLSGRQPVFGFKNTYQLVRKICV